MLMWRERMAIVRMALVRRFVSFITSKCESPFGSSFIVPIARTMSPLSATAAKRSPMWGGQWSMVPSAGDCDRPSHPSGPWSDVRLCPRPFACREERADGASSRTRRRGR